MQERVTARIEVLRAEYSTGEQTLAGLESQVASVRATLLRISGAIQVLEELLEEDDESSSSDELTSEQPVVSAL